MGLIVACSHEMKVALMIPKHLAWSGCQALVVRVRSEMVTLMGA